MKLYWGLLFLFFFSSCGSLHKEISIHRAEYKQGFIVDERSPLRESDLTYLDFYPPNAKGRVEAIFKRTPDEIPFEMPTYSGLTRAYRKYGNVFFVYEKDSFHLAVYENLTLRNNPAYQDYLFLPFKDQSNGVSTYGGGRYLNVSKKDVDDGATIVDFNKAYNPWCAFSDGFNCPIPPIENHLPVSITAGEKKYKGTHKISADSKGH